MLSNRGGDRGLPDRALGSGQGNGGGGGGGSSLIQSATVTLTNAQILTLPTLGVTVVAAQGANTVILPVSGFIVLDSSAGAYTGGTNASWILMLADNRGFTERNYDFVQAIFYPVNRIAYGTDFSRLYSRHN
jgi:hypothetical protein